MLELHHFIAKRWNTTSQSRLQVCLYREKRAWAQGYHDTAGSALDELDAESKLTRMVGFFSSALILDGLGPVELEQSPTEHVK